MPSPPPEARTITTHGAVFAFVLIAVIVSTVLPLRHYQASKAQIRALAARERAVDAEIAQLAVERQRLTSDGEVERLAREHLNMVRPGEIAFAIAGAAPDAAAAPAASAPAPKSHRPWYKAFWHWIWGG